MGGGDGAIYNFWCNCKGFGGICISALDNASRLMNIEAFGLMNLETSKSDCFVILKRPQSLEPVMEGRWIELPYD